MHEIYNEQYYKNYDVGIGTVNYLDSEYTKTFLEGIAAQIVQQLHPKSVLDAGCAMGHLVAALRDLGVDAYGIDISEYAIDNVREDVREYCVVGSLADPLPEKLQRKYDLIVSIEVLEHLTQEDGKRAIANLCGYTDRFVFSSTPDDFEDPTHINVRPREYWASIFAENGFVDDLACRPTFLTEYASSFRRSSDWMTQLEAYEQHIAATDRKLKEDNLYWLKAVEDKERHIQTQNSIIGDKERHIQTQNGIIEDKERHIQNQNSIIEDKDRHIRIMTETQNELNALCEQLRTDMDQWQEKYTSMEKTANAAQQETAIYQQHYCAAIAQRDQLQMQLNAILVSKSWRITKPLRDAVAGIKTLILSNRYTHLLAKGVKSLLRDGVKVTWKKVKNKLLGKNYVFIDVPIYSEEELQQQKKTKFSKNIKFSILVPLYNTPERFLHEMILSVKEQTYGNWELCLADGSDAEHQLVGEICKKYAQKDSRIVYKKLEKNMGISGNTNACIDMSTGDYIALFDHDDILHPAALFDVMKAVCEQNADFIYTDEATFESPDLKKIITVHCKPDYAIDNLRANNYICHFSVFSRAVMDRAGKFRAEYDGSQDHDLMLRLTTKAEKIVHVPKVLYYWRSHPQSVAQDIGAKTYAITAGKNAVRDSIAEYGYKAVVESSRAFPTIYRIRYELLAEPKVSIIIPNKNHVQDLRRCLTSIFERTTYKNFEIVIVDNGSDDPETLSYYEELKKYPRIVLCYLDIPFNYSALNNFAAKHATGEYYILLNNDTQVITPEWIEEMLMYVQREDVAAAGAMLYYPDDTIQHAGIILGLGADRTAGHPFYKCRREELGYMGRLCYSQNMSAVTAACMMVKASVYQEVGGFDESFAVAYNDVDLCLRMRKAGYLIVWTPHAELYHYESKSRGLEDTPEKRKRFLEEAEHFRTCWKTELTAGDPYYNPNFTLDHSDFRMK